MLTVTTSVSPTIKAAAVVVVRWGEREAFSMESLPVTLANRRIGHPMTLVRVGVISGLVRFKPMISKPQPIAKAIHCSNVS